jgi:hypothetical protein
LALLTGLCVTLALVAITLAATSSLATAESAPLPAKFAVSSNETVIAGTVVGVGDGLIGVQEANGAQPVAFPVVTGTALSREGVPASLADLRQHDVVHMTIDRTSGEVVQIVATPATSATPQPSDRLAAFALLGLIAGAVALVARRRTPLGVIEVATERHSQPARLRLGDLSLSPYLRRRQPEYQA